MHSVRHVKVQHVKTGLDWGHHLFMHALLTTFRGSTLVALSLLAGVTTAHTQTLTTDPDWKETEVPAPAPMQNVDITKLVPFVVSGNSELRWAVDPASIAINSDGLVRYVVIARSASGLINASYESINCGKAEFKIYARYNANGGWASIDDPQWRSLYDKLPSRHTLMLARQGACAGTAPAQSPTAMVQALKKTGTSDSN